MTIYEQIQNIKDLAERNSTDFLYGSVEWNKWAEIARLTDELQYDFMASVEAGV